MRPGLLLLMTTGCARLLEPVELEVRRDEAQLARGRYLAEAVMACGSCHSRRDWTRFAGPPKAGTEFTGSGDIARDEGFSERFSFTAPNLTPANLGAWSDGDVARAIVFGQRPDRRGLFPYMPYFETREALARDDLAALVAYLRTLPPVATEPPPPPRFGMPRFVMDTLPEARPLREKAPSPGAPDYGRYLTEIAGCMGCHTAADRRGHPEGPPYSGGREFPVPLPGSGTVRSANLTPDDHAGLGRWTKEGFVQRFRERTVEALAGQALEPGGFNTVMPWWVWARMSDADLGAIYDYLRSLPPSAVAVRRHTPTSP
jgi:mono/diheme cytochrome c family protein